MRPLATWLLFVLVLACMASIASAADGPPKELMLFNGKNLDGWKHRFPARAKGKMEDTWSVVDGVLV